MLRASISHQALKRIMSSLMAVLFAFTQTPLLAAEPAHPDKRSHHAPKKMPHNPVGAVSAQERAAMASARKHQFVLSAAPTDAEIFRSRAFSEPLVPMTGQPVGEENADLAKALIAFKAKDDPEDVSAVKTFMDEHPSSRWNAALALNVGLLRRETGYISEALALLKAAWERSKNHKGDAQSHVAQRAISELLFLEGTLGRLNEMKAGLAEIGNRPMVGSARERVDAARDAVQVMQKAPGVAFRCGPRAVQELMELKQGSPVPADSFIRKAPSTSQGNSLLEVKQLAARGGLKMQVAKRAPGAEVVVPSVMHWAAGHYGALTASSEGKFHLEDSTFDRNGNIWMSSKAIDAESDGFFLVPAETLPTGWQPVSDAEAATIFGKGYMQTRDEGKTCYSSLTCSFDECGNRSCSSSSVCIDDSDSGNREWDDQYQYRPPTDNTQRQDVHGRVDNYYWGPPAHNSSDFKNAMARASAWTMNAELNVRDTPLSYSVPIGPRMDFSLNYSQNEIEQPSSFTFSNLGPNWSTNWISWITIDGSDNATVHLRSGGVEQYEYTGNSGNPYELEVLSQADIEVPSAGVYHRVLRNGAIEVFDLDDGNGNFFLTEIITPRGTSATIQYDNNFRIESVTDANGNVSTFEHVSNNPMDPEFYLISEIHDPFGRSCSFSFDGNGFLETITDLVGIESSFTYDVGSGFMETMTTPYGTTSFDTYSITTGYTYPGRGLKFTYPDGTTSVIENTLDAENETHYWDREAMARYPDDPDDRIFSHCKKIGWFAEGFSENVFPIARYSKRPLESQITYTYPNQYYQGFYDTINRPSAVTQRNDYNLKSRFWITGTITPGDILYVRIWNNMLPGGLETVSYTVQTGDTANSILEEFVDLLNNDVELNKRGFYAEMDDGYLVTTPEDNYYSYSQSYTSGGSTETFNNEFEQDWGRSPVFVVLGGSVTPGDIVYLHSPFPPSYPVYSYTAVSGDTLESVAQKLAYIIASDATAKSRNWSAAAIGNKIWLHIGWGGGGFWANYSGTTTAGTTGVTDQTQTLYEWNALGNPTKVTDPLGREMSFEYAANDIDLEEVHETRDSNDFVVSTSTFNSQHLPLTHIDGSGQETDFTYNVFGQVTSVTDPLANVTTYEYTSTATATVGGSISTSDQASITVSDPDLPGGSETVSHTATPGQTASNVASALASNINGNTDLQALGVSASANGAVVTIKSISVNATSYSRAVTGGVTVALSPVAYGFLTKITGPLQENDITTLVWNENGTVASTTDAEGYTLTFDYDDMDRLLKTTFPDGTASQTVFQDLDAVFFIDRLGRTAQRSFDNMDQLILEIDPLGRKTSYTWCSCGSLSALTDAAGNTTTWNHDLEGRIIEKVLEDGTKTKYIWETNRSVLELKRDALGQETNYFHMWDGNLTSVQYTDAINATSAVLNTFDSHFARLVQSRNGWGAYNYLYNDYITDPADPPITGGGNLATISNSAISNSDITFEYDELGRTTKRSIDAANNEITLDYDSMSRVVSETNELGQFDFTYIDDGVGVSKGQSRLASIAYPNGQTTNFDWYGNDQDQRLREIKNLDPNSQALSQFNYAQDTAGQITRWMQQQKSRHLGFGLDYDSAGQLTAAVSGKGVLPAPYADQHFFSYDSAANRTGVQTGQVQNLVIGGSKTTSDVITVTASDSGLSGGTEAVAYTVLSGDTLTTIAANLAATITANSDCQSVGIDAISNGTTVTLRSKSPNVTTFTTSLSGGATETASLGVNAALHNVTIGGSKTTSDVVQITVHDPALGGGSASISRTVQGGDTLTSIATALTSSINGSGSLSAAGITATSNGPVIAIQSLSPNVTTFTKSVTGAATETVAMGPSLNGTVNALIGGSKTTADVLTLTVFDAGLSSGQKAVSYTVQSGDNLTSITSGFASAINSDTDLQGIGVTASSSGTLLTVKSVSRNATSYLSSRSSSATETILWDLPANGTVTAVIGGTKTTGNVLTITVYDAGLAGGSKAVGYTVQSGDTLNLIASGLATNINADTDLQGIGVSAVAVMPASAVSVINLTSTSKNATTYLKSLSGGATETIALSKNVGVSQATFNNVNELTGVSAGGNARFQGNTDRPVLPVTVAGNAVDMPTSQTFSGSASLSSGSNSVSVSATAGGGSGTTTNAHKLEVEGAGSQTLTYDDNGNMTSDGTNSFAWDAENRLIQITYPGANNRTEFTYGPTGGRVKIVETVSGSVTSTKQFVGSEERDGSGTVTKQFFSEGQRNGSTNYFYSRDHLGSVRTVTDDNGLVQASYAFEPYGRVAEVEGVVQCDFGFAGMYCHSRSGLNLTLGRPYSASIGCWISADPLGGDRNYSYADENPVCLIDPLGLVSQDYERIEAEARRLNELLKGDLSKRRFHGILQDFYILALEEKLTLPLGTMKRGGRGTQLGCIGQAKYVSDGVETFIAKNGLQRKYKVFIVNRILHAWAVLEPVDPSEPELIIDPLMGDIFRFRGRPY